MKVNLLGRFIVIILVTLIAAFLVWKIPPRLGIDLAGGTALLYELDTTKLSPDEDVSKVAGRVIEVLRQRVDPQGQKNIIWRVVGGKRIQIQMPYPPKVVRQALARRDEAQKVLDGMLWRTAAVDAAARIADENERNKAFEQFAPAGSEEFKRLQALAVATKVSQEINAEIDKIPADQPVPAELLARRIDASKQLTEARSAAMSSSADLQTLQNLLNNAERPDDPKAREELEAYAKQFPRQQKEIDSYIKAFREYRAISGGGVDDPNELERLVTRAGVLDFRIAVLPSEISQSEYTDAVESLNEHGPEHQILVGGIKARWFPIDANSRNNFAQGYVTAEFNREPHVLCYDDSRLNNPNPRTLTHSDPARKPWSITAGTPYNDPVQGITLPFELNAVGASYMGELTEVNKGHPMTILLDDRAISAPNINGHITDKGVITFGRGRSPELILKEANDLKRIMDAGSLPATLQSSPISKQEISSNMGADNIEAGMRSSVYAVIAVVFFMLMYYTLTGLFADVALMLNLLFVLATMAIFEGTFTLPGIAGLVLTLGMAVDANVLINERIREEIHRGASLWMAIKQGYDRVFWTIFDSNLTTGLIAIVLYYVGSEDVKGFGLTLLIGLGISMFTALYVTRTFMMAAVKWNILRAIDDHSFGEYLREIFTFTWLRNGHFPFMRVVTVSNIDWIGKRWYFWTFSIIVTVAGLVAFAIRGEDKYDIEFRGGTQITFHLREPAPGEKSLTIEEVREMIQGIAKPSHPLYTKTLEQLADANVYTIGGPDERRFEMQTTIRNKPQNFGETLPGPLTKEFGIAADALEFRSNSDATTVRMDLTKATGATPTAADVARRVRALAATSPALEDLENVNVHEVDQFAGHFDVIIQNSNIEKTLVLPLAEAFKDYVDIAPPLAVRGRELDVREMESEYRIVPITSPQLDQVFSKNSFRGIPAEDVRAFEGGVAILLEDISPPVTRQKLYTRIDSTRRTSLFQNVPHRPFDVIPITVRDADGKDVPAGSGLATGQPETRPMTRAAVVTVDQAHKYDENKENIITLWRSKAASTEWNIVRASLEQGKVFDGITSFDAVVANQAKVQAGLAILLSLVLIVIYVWVRFGGIWYGVGAIVALGHDAIVAVAATVLSGVLYRHIFGQHEFLLITDFKINLTMVAAYLTIIGYSVNDTIVIFDRVRELRGKSMMPVTRKIINDAVNQCFGRTIWTTFTVFIVLLIMYVWGGVGVRGFAFAMLCGVITGAYSTLAIASPMLLLTGTGGPAGPTTENPFKRKDAEPDDETHIAERAV